MAAGKSSAHLLGNSAWNASAFLVSVGLNLFILPFVLFRLGASVFGVAGLVTACIAPALAFSSSLALSTTRELAYRLAPEQRTDARGVFATALLLAAAGGVPIAMILSLAGPPLARHAFHLDGEGANDVAFAFLFGAGGWLCQCISGVFLSLFTARLVDAGSHTALATGFDVPWLSGLGPRDGSDRSVHAGAPGGR